MQKVDEEDVGSRRENTGCFVCIYSVVKSLLLSEYSINIINTWGQL